MKKGFHIRKSVFIPLCAIYILVTLLGIVVPEAFAAVQNAVVGFAAGWFGWLYQIVTIVLIIICVWVLFSKKAGSIRIGGPNAKPTMSKWNWFAISLCSGIATGIVAFIGGAVIGGRIFEHSGERLMEFVETA